MTDQDFLGHYGILFSRQMRLAHQALLLWAEEMEPDAWPTVPTILRFARFYDVNPGELAALVGIIRIRVDGGTRFIDTYRQPEHVKSVTVPKTHRRNMIAYEYYVTAAELVARDRAVLH